MVPHTTLSGSNIKVCPAAKLGAVNGGNPGCGFQVSADIAGEILNAQTLELVNRKERGADTGVKGTGAFAAPMSRSTGVAAAGAGGAAAGAGGAAAGETGGAPAPPAAASAMVHRGGQREDDEDEA